VRDRIVRYAIAFLLGVNLTLAWVNWRLAGIG